MGTAETPRPESRPSSKFDSVIDRAAISCCQAFTTYWDVANPNAGRSDLVQSQMGHACEWETSMILRIAPHLVKEISRLEEVPFGFAFEPAYRGWITKDRTVPGHIGNPKRFASAGKGSNTCSRRFPAEWSKAAGTGHLVGWRIVGDVKERTGECKM